MDEDAAVDDFLDGEISGPPALKSETLLGLILLGVLALIVAVVCGE